MDGMPARTRTASSAPWWFLVVLLALGTGTCSSEKPLESPAASPSAEQTATTTTLPGPARPVAPLPAPTTSPLPLTGYDVPGWAEAVAQIEEKRGSTETLDVPAELHHAADKRVFLATQLADATRTAVHTPHDLADLARMVRAGELVEVPPLSEDHLLYDVGADVRVDPLTHYDENTDKVTPLLEGEPEYADLTGLAADFAGYRYDLTNPSDRVRFQARLLSALRPEAKAVLDEIASAYHARFGRRLPVSSLVRTLQYQRRLSRVNPNASRLEVSPHTTGLAFDILDKFMPNDEQNFVMQEVARLERDGRVEALRERRNHIHVYVFETGERPPETLVASFFDEVEAAHPGSAPHASVSRARPGPKARVAAARKKATRAAAVRRKATRAKAAAKRPRRTRSARRR